MSKTVFIISKIFFMPVVYITFIINCAAQEFKTVVIGTQEWSAEDYSTTTFRNGDPIPEAASDEEWVIAAKEKKPATCLYCIDYVKGKQCQRLYNFYVISDQRGFAPNGWHVPSDPEWGALEMFLGMKADTVNLSGKRGKTFGSKLKAKSGWAYMDGKSCNGTDDYGFAAEPTGLRGHANGKKIVFAEIGNWWTSSFYDDNAAYRSLYCLSEIERNGCPKGNGLAVRLIKNK